MRKYSSMSNIVKLAITAAFLALSFSGTAVAKDDKEKRLPPGLQKRVDQGKGLPPGWQKKLVVGEPLDMEIYRHGKIVATDDAGLVILNVEGKLIKIMQDTREIVEILKTM